MILNRLLAPVLVWATVAVPSAHAQWLPSGAAGQSSVALAEPARALALARAARVLVVGQDDKRLSVFDPDAGIVLGQVELPEEPRSLAITADGRRAYAVYGSDKLTAVDVDSATALATWSLGKELRSVVLAAGETELVVADAASGRLLAVDPANGAITREIALSHEPREVVAALGGARLAISAAQGWLMVIDAISFTEVARLKLADDIRSLAWWEAGSRLLAVHKRADALSLVDIVGKEITATIPLEGDPERAAVAQDAGVGYIATHHDASLHRVELGGPALLGRYAVAARLDAVVFDPVASTLYGAPRGDRRLLRLDPSGASLLSVVQLQKRLRDVAVNDAQQEAVAVAEKSDEMFIMKLADRSLRTIALPARPELLALDTKLNRAVVAFRGTGPKLRFVDLATGALFPEAIADPRNVLALTVDTTRALGIALLEGRGPVVFVDLAKRLRLADGPVETYRALAVHAKRGVAYLATESRQLQVLELSSRAIVATVSLGFKADAIAVDESLDRATITTGSEKKAHVLNLETLTLETGFALPKNPGAVAVQSDTHLAVVLSRESNAVSLVDLKDGVATAGFASVRTPHALAVSARYNEALVLSAEQDDVTFVPLPNPLPVLHALAPSYAELGGAALVVKISGTGFVEASRAYFGDAALSTRWQSATELQAEMPASLLATPLTAPVTVRNPAPAGGISNALAFTVLGGPALVAIVPPNAEADAQEKTLALSGSNFAAGASVLFGASNLPAVVHSPTSLTTVVPGALTSTAGTVLLRVVNPGGLASNSLPFTLTPRLAIHAVTPASGEVGTLITLAGAGFDPTPANNQLAFRSIGGATVMATAVTASLDTVTLKVPPLADSGPIALTNSRGTVQSPHFDVIRPQDYRLSISPAALAVYQGASGSLQAQLSSTGTKPFTGLVSLSAHGLPANVAAEFAPPMLSVFQTGVINLGVLGSASPGQYPVTIRAEMKEGGQAFTRTAQATLTVLPSAGVTGVKGRFVTPEGKGIAEVIVRADIAMDPQPQTRSDAAGNFQLIGLPAGAVTLRFDAVPAHPLYPIWPHTLTLPAHTIRVLEDWVIAPPPPDERFTGIATNSPQEQVITDPRYPGLEIRIPPGTDIVGWDGIPKKRIAVERLDPDKLPVAAPPIKTNSVYQLYFGSAMGGLPSAPIPVTLPNDLGLEPGMKTELWYYDGSPMGGSGEWKQGGMGTVSADGSVIVADPGSGIPRFCGVCGLPCYRAAQDAAPNPPCPDCDGIAQQYGKPVNLATGQELAAAVDLVVDGEVPIVIRRVFNPFDAFAYVANFQQSLGVNWTFAGYDVAMLPFGGDHTVRIVLPGNARIDFKRGSDGRFRSSGYSTFDGAELIKVGGTNPSSAGFLAGGPLPPTPGVVSPTCTAEGSFYLLQFKDGRIWRFDAAPNATKVKIAGGCLHFLTEMRDRQGRFVKITRSEGKLQRIETSGGQSVAFTYTNGVVSNVADNAGRSVAYQHENVAAKGAFGAFGATSAGGSNASPAAIAEGIVPIAPWRLTSAQTPEGTYAYTYEDDPPSLRLGALSFDDPSGGTAISADTPTCLNVRGGTRIKTVQLPGIQGLFTNYYGPSKRVLRQTWPDGTEIRFGYKIVGGCVPGVISLGAQPGSGAPLVGGSDTSVCSGAGCVRVDSWEGQSVTGGSVVGVEVTDSRGRRFLHDFNASGLALRTVDQNGQELRIVRDAHNRVTRVTDALGRITQYQYDTRGNRTRIVDPAGRETLIEYDAQWNTPTLIARRLDESVLVEYRYSYDADTGALLTSIDPEGAITSYQYDASGRLSVLRDPLKHETVIRYDSRGNPERVVDPLGNAVQMLTDSAGRIIAATDALGNQTRAEYNALNQLLRITDARLGETRFNFDARNNLASVVNPLDQAIESYGYDALGRLISKTDAHQRTEGYGYDANGNLATVTDRRGQVMSVDYDHANRPSRITFHDGAVQERIYDAAGRLTEVREPDNAQGFEYDVLDRVTRVVSDTAAGRASVHYEYDALDRRTRRIVSYPGGIQEDTAYAYDRASRLVSIGHAGVNGTHITTYAWDAAGRLTEKRLPNGLRQRLTYDAANRLLAIRYLKTDDSVLEFIEYAYDGNGQRVLKASGAPVLPDTPFAATYDAANRMTTITLLPNTPAAKTYALSYDEHGNLNSKTNTAAPGEVTHYSWDARNRLVAITAADGALTSSAAFKYDALGRRIERTISQGASGQRVEYVYDGIQAIGELVDGHLAATVLTGLNIDEVIARTVNISGGNHPIATRTYLTDVLSNVLVLAREDQSPTTYYAYSPYGETAQLGSEPESPSNFIQFTARESHAEVGGTNAGQLYYFRARYYDNVLSRFLSEDPIGLMGGPNAYSYVGGNPVAYSDPSGLLVGSLLARLFGRMLQRTPDEIGYIGQLFDVGVGSFVNLAPPCVRAFDVRGMLDALRGFGGYQAVALSTATTFGLYGAGATIGSLTASGALPVTLALYGGWEMGSTFNSVWERGRGNTLGGDIYDLVHHGRLLDYGNANCPCSR